MLDPVILDIARAVERAGGRALLVGGCVRDRLLDLEASVRAAAAAGEAAPARLPLAS